MAWIDSATVATITAPHLLYAFIWFLPGLWRRGFRKPVKAFEIAASLGKGSQDAHHSTTCRGTRDADDII